jgi:hypothetical protein
VKALPAVRGGFDPNERQIYSESNSTTPSRDKTRRRGRALRPSIPVRNWLSLGSEIRGESVFKAVSSVFSLRASRYRIAALTENASLVFASKLLPSAVQIAPSKPP